MKYVDEYRDAEGAGKLVRAIERTVRPERVQHRIAVTSASIAACDAARVSAIVIRSPPPAIARGCSRPSRFAHAR